MTHEYAQSGPVHCFPFYFVLKRKLSFFNFIYYSETKRRRDDQIKINYSSECSVLTLFVFSI